MGRAGNSNIQTRTTISKFSLSGIPIQVFKDEIHHCYQIYFKQVKFSNFLKMKFQKWYANNNNF